MANKSWSVQSLVLGAATVAIAAASIGALSRINQQRPVIGIGSSWRSMAHHTQVDINSLSKYGVVIIPSSDAEFDKEMFRLVKNDREDLLPLIEAAKPFSMFVKNRSSQEVVACNVTWQFTDFDGAVVIIPQSFSTPGALMGMKARDERMVGHTSLINPGNALFFSLDNVLFEALAARGNLPGGSFAAAEKSRNELTAYASQITNKYQQKLKTLQNITITLDGVFFRDGSFVGPDSTHLFTTIQAQVDAKREIARRVTHAIGEQKSLSMVFGTLASLSDEPLGGRGQNTETESLYDQIYQTSLSVFAAEILQVKERRGEREALEYLQRPLEAPWPRLRRVE